MVNIFNLLPFYFGGYIIASIGLIDRFGKKLPLIKCCFIILLLINIFIIGKTGISYYLNEDLVKEYYIAYLLNKILSQLIAWIWILGLYFILYSLKEGKIKKIIGMIGTFSLQIYALQILPTKLVGHISIFADNQLVLNIIWTPIISIIIYVCCFGMGWFINLKMPFISFVLFGKVQQSCK